MATSVKRRVTGRGMQVTDDNRWEVTHEYYVLGPTSELDVYGAVDDDTGFKLPEKGDPHPENTGLIVASVSIDESDLTAELGPVWDARITWRSPTFTDALPEPEWQWGDGSVSIDADSDENRNPFVNSAGDPITGTFQDEIPTGTLTVWLPQPFFDPALMFAVKNRVNSAAMTLFGTWSIGEQQMRCVGMRPTGRQKRSTLSVTTEFNFEFRDGYRPFQPKSIDRGFNGFYSGGGTKLDRFYSLYAKDPYEDAVLLDGTGKPINTTFRVGAGYAAPIANPSVPNWFTIEPGGPTTSRQLVYARKKTYDFRNFIAGVM